MPNKKNGKITNGRKQMTSFLIEELKENWAYIRHMEQIRLKHIQVFLIITGAIVSVFSLLIEPAGANWSQQSLKNLFNLILTQHGFAISTGSLFIFLYGFLLCVFLAHQKRGYEHYRIVNAEIRNWFTENYGKESQFSFEKKRSHKRTTWRVITSTFFYWYLLVVLINCIAFMAFIVTIVPLWSLITKVILIVSMFCFECWTFIRLNKNIKKG